MDALHEPQGPALAAAREASLLLLSHDHHRIDADVAAARAVTTGQFSQECADVSEKVVRPHAVENQAVVQAQSITADVTEATDGERVVAPI